LITECDESVARQLRERGGSNVRGDSPPAAIEPVDAGVDVMGRTRGNHVDAAVERVWTNVCTKTSQASAPQQIPAFFHPQGGREKIVSDQFFADDSRPG
jgi:hypothetical protein